MAPQLTLWKLDASPPATAVRILADILNVKLHLIDVDFVNKGHKAPEFMKLNPLGTVPLLKDGDFLLTDSHAQMKYLLGNYGTTEQQESLYPVELKARAIVDQAMFFDAGVMFIKVKLVALPTLFEGLKELTPRLAGEIDSTYAVVEAYLGDNKYVAADHLTLADLSLGCTAVSLDSVYAVDGNKYPKTKAWLSRLDEIAAFKKYAVGPKGLGGFLRSFWEK